MTIMHSTLHFLAVVLAVLSVTIVKATVSASGEQGVCPNGYHQGGIVYGCAQCLSEQGCNIIHISPQCFEYLPCGCGCLVCEDLASSDYADVLRPVTCSVVLEETQSGIARLLQGNFNVLAYEIAFGAIAGMTAVAVAFCRVRFHKGKIGNVDLEEELHDGNEKHTSGIVA